MKKWKQKKAVVWLLIFAFTCPLLPETSQDVSAKTIESEFDALGDKFGSMLDEQMNSYLTGGANPARVQTDETYAGLHSKITFEVKNPADFPLQKESEDAADQLMRWLNQALANYPNLCTLFTKLEYSYTADTSHNRYLKDFSVYSPVKAGEIRNTTNSYKEKLTELVSVPKSSRTMTKVEKIRYVHNEIIRTADYAYTNDYTNNTAMAVLLNKKGVCQSYAYTFNNAMREIGVDSVLLVSSTHAWNAVRINGKWFYVDVTWDDPTYEDPNDISSTYIRYDYFLVAPTAFAADHTLIQPYQTTYSKILTNIGSEEDLNKPDPADPTGTPATTESPQTPTTVPTDEPAASQNPDATEAPQNPTPTVSPSATPKTPAKPSIKLKNSVKGKVLVTINKVKNAAGYQISYSSKKSFKKEIRMNTKKRKVMLTRMKKGKTYYVRVRAYSLINKTKHYGKWCKGKAVRIKKGV